MEKAHSKQATQLHNSFFHVFFIIYLCTWLKEITFTLADWPSLVAMIRPPKKTNIPAVIFGFAVLATIGTASYAVMSRSIDKELGAWPRSFHKDHSMIFH